MHALISTLTILRLISVTSPSVVKWVPNASFNLPANFKDGKLPCSKENVVFPKSISGSVGLQSVMEIGSLILPEDGEIVLDNAVIALGRDEVDSNCTEGNSYYLDKSTSSWTQAGVWSSSKFNEATPDAERVPCYDDVVEFSRDTKYTVRLPDAEQLVATLRVGNESFSTSSFYDLVTSQSDQMQQFMLNVFLGTGVRVVQPSCQVRFGCPCQPNAPAIDCTVKFCPKPACLAPIKPPGYCCSLCGGQIAFELDEGFDMASFRDLVEKTVDAYGGVAYHIGFASTSPRYRVRVVIVDKEDFDGSSVEAINDIDGRMMEHWYRGEKLAQVSGGPLSTRYLGGKIFISVFFAVVLVMGGIYVYFYKLPQVRIPGVRGAGGAARLFSRFQYRSDSVVSLTRRDSAVSAALPARGFRNPLYDSRRERVHVEQSVDEE